MIEELEKSLCFSKTIMLVDEDLQDFVIREENYYFFARFVPSLTFSHFFGRFET